jgi:PilZ domain
MDPSTASLTELGRDESGAQSIERRREPRTEVDIRGRVKSINPLTSTGPSTVVQIVEISRHGLKLFVTRPYIVNMLVQITIGSQFIMGKVRHCTKLDKGYHVGVERIKNPSF